ncbi:hypothetical protein ACFLVD_00415 [Chloroflexota bacterium]
MGLIQFIALDSVVARTIAKKGESLAAITCKVPDIEGATAELVVEWCGE